MSRNRDRSPKRVIPCDTNDPALKDARIFVGSLPPNFTAEELEEHFIKYGRILGVSCHQGFAFVQFGKAMDAEEAIKLENGGHFKGKKIDVRTTRNQKEVSPTRGGGRRGESRFSGGGFRDGEGRGRGVREGERGRGRDRDRGRGRDGRDVGRRDGFRDRSPINDDFPRYGGRDGFDDNPFNGRDRFGRDRERLAEDPYMDFYRGEERQRYRMEAELSSAGRMREPPREIPRSAPIRPAPKANDCEIVVLNKQQREYAEMVEKRVMALGLVVDMLFPRPDAPLPRIIEDISGRGTMYCVVISAQNEDRRSLTLSILQGTPQEHRNMPLEDALTLLSRNVSQVVAERLPEGIQQLLTFVLENRPLTALEYDRLIKFFQTKRDKQLQDDEKLAPAIPMPVPMPVPAPVMGSSMPVSGNSIKQAELQQKILTMLNKQQQQESRPMPAISSASGPSPAFSNPTIQKALNSLITTGPNLLAAPSSTPMHTQSFLGQPPANPLFGAYQHGAY